MDRTHGGKTLTYRQMNFFRWNWWKAECAARTDAGTQTECTDQERPDCSICLIIFISQELGRLLNEPGTRMPMSHVRIKIDRYITDRLLASRREDENVYILNEAAAALMAGRSGQEMSRFEIRRGLSEHVRLFV